MKGIEIKLGKVRILYSRIISVKTLGMKDNKIKEGKVRFRTPELFILQSVSTLLSMTTTPPKSTLQEGKKILSVQLHANDIFVQSN